MVIYLAQLRLINRFFGICIQIFLENLNMKNETYRKLHALIDVLYRHNERALEKANISIHLFNLLGARHVPTDLLINEGVRFTYEKNIK